MVQYLFVQTNTGAPQNDPVNGATVSETVNGFVAGQKYVFNVFDAARNGQAPIYKVVLDSGTPTAQVIYIGSPTSNTFTQKYSVPFTTTAGSHVLRLRPSEPPTIPPSSIRLPSCRISAVREAPI